MFADEHFNTTELADTLCNRLLEPGIFRASDGLFLSLSGMEGGEKTFFLKLVLVPMLQKRGALVIYVGLELVQDATQASSAVLESIARALKELSSPAKFQEQTGEAVAPSFSFKPETVGRVDGVTLADAFVEVVGTIDKNIVLIINDVETLLKSKSGRRFLFALKAARDAVNLRLNNPKDTYALVVGAGSDPSLISAMTSRTSQPFFGAEHMALGSMHWRAV